MFLIGNLPFVFVLEIDSTTASIPQLAKLKLLAIVEIIFPFIRLDAKITFTRFQRRFGKGASL